jgi:hypothetical protein
VYGIQNTQGGRTDLKKHGFKDTQKRQPAFYFGWRGWRGRYLGTALVPAFFKFKYQTLEDFYEYK